MHYKDNDINKNGFGIELKGYLNLNERFLLTMYFEEGIISEVQIWGWDHPEQYEISRVVNILGQPDSITNLIMVFSAIFLLMNLLCCILKRGQSLT